MVFVWDAGTSLHLSACSKKTLHTSWLLLTKHLAVQDKRYTFQTLTLACLFFCIMQQRDLLLPRPWREKEPTPAWLEVMMIEN